MPWKILVTDGLDENGQAILRAAAQVDDRSGISEAELVKIIYEFDALVVRSRTRVSSEVLAAANSLKVVGRAGVGVDNIDLQAARERQVIVVNAPVSTSLAVAELALGMMFALARALPRADRAMKQDQWLKKELMGTELSGKTLGVVGMGNIGATVAKRAAALGMQVLGYDPFLPAEEIGRRNAQPVSLDELFARSDFISIHVPLTPETRSMISRQVLAQMKPGVHLICTARGGLIDETALLEALNSGQVAGAALDVFAQEPPGASALVLHPNVIATPHIGAQTVEAQARAAEDIAHEILAALEEKPLRWRVV
jgi:D-3-phosphoglycerate dehydrogenase / 2-oxoglutarate reductase